MGTSGRVNQSERGNTEDKERDIKGRGVMGRGGRGKEGDGTGWRERVHIHPFPSLSGNQGYLLINLITINHHYEVS